MKQLALAIIGLLLIPGAVRAQSEGRFQTGVVTWTPTLTLRDTGLDTNLYDEAENPRRDTSAVFAPEVSGIARLAAADVRFGGDVSFVYFQRYTQERSINRAANVRVEFHGARIRPFLRGAFLDSRERSNDEIDARARRSDREGGAGLALQLSPRSVLEIGGGVRRATYRANEVFRGVDLAHRLNRDSHSADVRLKYAVTPLTRVLAEASAGRERYMSATEYDATSIHLRAGVEFDPDAVIAGRATVGFRRIDPIGAMALGYEGMTAGVELRYLLLQRTRFTAEISRDTSSSMEAQPYFLETVYGGEIRHNLLGPLDVIGRAMRDLLDYPGIPDLRIVPDAVRVTRYGGAISVRPRPSLDISVNYEHARRDSDMVPERRFERDRFYTTITYGF